MPRISDEEIARRVETRRARSYELQRECFDFAKRITAHFQRSSTGVSKPRAGWVEISTPEEERIALRCLSGNIFHSHVKPRAALVVVSSENLSDDSLRKIMRTTNVASLELYPEIMKHPNASKATKALAYQQYVATFRHVKGKEIQQLSVQTLGKALSDFAFTIGGAWGSASVKDLAVFFDRASSESDDVLEIASQFIRDQQTTTDVYSMGKVSPQVIYDVMRTARRI